jgi:enterochelin esterase-like enzyme
MITRRSGLASAISASVTLPFGDARASDLITYPMMSSAFIEPRKVQVWVPPDYYTSSKRYPVIYFHDGQNAISPQFAFRGQPWGIDAAISRSMTSRGAQGGIVVAIWNTPQRRSDYAPNAIQDLLPAPLRERVVTQNGRPAAGDAYLKFIVHELKPFIDANFRTLHSRASTSLMGSSRGGMISLYGLCEHPNVFSSAASLSTHWLLLSAPEPNVELNLATDDIVRALTTYLHAKLPLPGSHKVWMDHGTLNLDRFYGPYQESVDVTFSARGWIKGRNFESQVYQGGDHNEIAWRTRLNDPLDFILGS